MLLLLLLLLQLPAACAVLLLLLLLLLLAALAGTGQAAVVAVASHKSDYSKRRAKHAGQSVAHVMHERACALSRRNIMHDMDGSLEAWSYS